MKMLRVLLAHIDFVYVLFRVSTTCFSSFSACSWRITSYLTRRKMPVNPRVKYHRVNDTDGYIDAQFRKPPPRVPVKAICLASGLFLVGTILLVIGSLLFSGYFDVKYGDRTYPMLILGSLMFIPGFYHVRIAYYAWKGYRGYSFEDIPDFN